MNTCRRRLSVLLAGLMLSIVAAGLLPSLPPVVAAPVVSGSDNQSGSLQSARPRIGARATETGAVFELDGMAPPDATEAILWYDTEQGRQTRRFPVRAGQPIRRSLPVSFVEEGLAVAMPFGGRLDYWWALRGADGQVTWRDAGVLFLPPRLRALARPPTPALARPFEWSEATSEHFRLRFYPGSAAERDVEKIKRAAEDALVRASAIISPTEPVSITAYLVPRVFWQGGAAYDGSTLLMSYTDRNYAGIEPSLYLLHESVHVLAHGLVAEEGDVGGLIGEGVATYATGGHYGPEPIDAWTAALRRNGRFVPLCRLRVTFFDQQHEIAYLEGASFVGYLIRTYGLPAFRTFYAEEPAIPEDAHANIDAFCEREATRPVAGIGKTYAELEAGWMRWLDEQDPSAAEQAGIESQLRFFDLMRHYQEVHDPNARVLPPPPGRWNADLQQAFASPAMTETNTIYETMFIAADRALDAGDPAAAGAVMDELDIAVDTGVFTGTTGREVAAIGSLLRRTARAYRLGETRGYAALPAAGGGVEPLWTDYRLVLNSLELEQDGAQARVERLSRPLGGPVRREGLNVSLARGALGWRITTAVPDPQRPPIVPAPRRREPARIAGLAEWLAGLRGLNTRLEQIHG